MKQVFIGVGSNLADPEQQIRHAVLALKSIENTQFIQSSSLYFSRPMGPQDQPDYMNAVVELSTNLSPLALLDQLQKIETQAGRVRKGDRWGARILDLDIIIFADQVINSQRLIVPHYGMKEREFVLIPLAEITTNYLLPSGENVSKLATEINANGLKIHSELK